jgi:hypothetical protein
MYEEEDDDLPTQYQRLNAHLQTSSWLFNRKLHDYIATQHGVRNMFLHQQFPGMQPFAPISPSTQTTFMNTSMLPPQSPNSTTPTFMAPQPFGTQSYPQAMPGYRHAPYNIPQRPQAHQRSASTSTPQAAQSFAPATAQANSSASTSGAETDRRLSLPPHVLEQTAQSGDETQSRPSLSSTPSSLSVSLQPQSPQPLSLPDAEAGTPGIKSENASTAPYQFPTFSFDTSSQVLQMNPLSFSLPPESQQFIGSALDPNDPRTAALMAGSENLPQPFRGHYTYNPNLSPKSSQLKNAGDRSNLTLDLPAPSTTLAPVAGEESTKLDTSANTPPSAMLDHMFTSNHLFTPTGSLDYTSYFGQYPSTDANRSGLDDLFGESYEESSLINWDQTSA